MNRLLLKECLDELRSDDSVELTEAHKNRRKSKKRTQGDSGRPLSGHSDRPREHNPKRSPTPVDPNAEQNLASLRQSLSQGRRLSQGQMLKELVMCLGGPVMENYDNTRYYYRGSKGSGLLRIGDHRANANEFAHRGEWTGNYGIDINLPWSWKRFREDKRVDYKEEVYMPQDMTAENEIKMVDGVVNWIRTGVYTGPAGWETNLSVRTLNPDGTPIQAPPQGGQPPTPPATPPTGPEVQESLAAKYFKEAHSMKYRLLKEAALKTLLEEDNEMLEGEERGHVFRGLDETGVAYCPNCRLERAEDNGVGIHYDEDENGNATLFRVMCGYCGLASNYKETEEDAVKDWNRLVKEIEHCAGSCNGKECDTNCKFMPHYPWMQRTESAL